MSMENKTFIYENTGSILKSIEYSKMINSQHTCISKFIYNISY